MAENLRRYSVKTRKPHKCFGCCRIFPKGTTMEFSVDVDMGSAFNSYLCNDCLDFMRKHIDYFEDGFSQGEVKRLMIDEGVWNDIEIKEG